MSTFPTIHLNGTAKQDLQAGYEAAYRAIGAALDTLAQCSPNGRDYYPQGADALPKAITEFEQHMVALKAAQTYCLEHHVHCDEVA